MKDLDWLVEHRFESLTRREYDWIFSFDNGVTFVVYCLWRLVEGGRIQLTSQDEGQQFGLPAPVKAVSEINRRLALAAIHTVQLREGLLDLDLHFSSGHILQIIPDSSGYEAWEVSDGFQQFIAGSGGDLVICGGNRNNSDPAQSD